MSDVFDVTTGTATTALWSTYLGSTLYRNNDEYSLLGYVENLAVHVKWGGGGCITPDISSLPLKSENVSVYHAWPW